MCHMELKVQKESLSLPVGKTVKETPAERRDRCLWQWVGTEQSEFLGSVMSKLKGQDSGVLLLHLVNVHFNSQ